MLWMTGQNTGTVIMDIAALFLLTGVVYYTGLYRQRGRIDDRLFFAMLITDIIAAIADAAVYTLEESTAPNKAVLLIIADSIFSMCMAIVPMIWILYLTYQLKKDEDLVRRLSKLVVIPIVWQALLVMANWKWGFLYSTNEAGEYAYSKIYEIVYIPAAIFLIFMIISFIRLDIKLVAAFVILVALRRTMNITVGDMSATSFVIAVLLIYSHIYVMNEEFFEGGAS